MKGLARLTGHESCTRVAEASDFQVLPIRRRRRKKENFITYHRQVTVEVMTRTVSSLTCVKKRRKGTVEATSKNKEIDKSKKTLVNSHCSFVIIPNMIKKKTLSLV